MIRYAISCLGCKVNTYEAESISQSLKLKGYIEVGFKETADVYLIFTCAVTNTAASKSRQKINQAIRLNEDAIICVVGCYVQINAENMKENEHIDILVGSSHKQDIPRLIEETLSKKEKHVLVEDVRENADFETLSLSHFEHQTRAYMKIQDGCNQFCSYCIIPYARGKERSYPLEKVVETARKLSVNHKEIVLAGIHTGRYGHDIDLTLTKCLKEVLKQAPLLERIRISSIEITEITDELIELMKQDNRIARHLHIPIQSGCNETLKRMNRPYTKEEFIARVNEIRNELPHVSISTDLIVGFPQESEEEFNETIKTIHDCSFSFMHVFPFSSKTGTVAEKMKGQVIDKIKKERVQTCSNLSKNLYYTYKASFINKEVSVLIEEHRGDKSFGHSSEYLPITIEGIHPHNQFVDVVVTHLINDELIGKVKG
ncbi:tRNA (N(6)-L-threonylcarbamoyladenosine(37)-C(2))-methylthiotransferase MtaB [Anaerorhabdus sp.]|uniref:tRNA (N(6)-L-threonylcarbamoyladenosine(37)-C(2))- methylthiotransferase MtaB n=1 Tax=Anaerorhabdus sp. TaxID=1872524 RepID=UPI002FCA8AD3